MKAFKVQTANLSSTELPIFLVLIFGCLGLFLATPISVCDTSVA